MCERNKSNSNPLRKLNESIQKLREGLYDYARQENEFRESIDAVNVVRDEMHKK